MYVYTIPRCLPAAAYGSPGPKYRLPGLTGQKDHDGRSLHNRASAWSFGQRSGKFKDDCSPGPKYVVGKYTRHGGDGVPKYSIYGRPSDMSAFRTPGAGAYSPETHCYTYHQSPVYSFGTRHRHRRSDDTPAPNCYSLPNMTGKTPQAEKRSAACYSLSGKAKIGGFDEDHSKAPGPGTYKVTEPSVYKNALPQFSMTGRHSMPGDTTQKPGPGAHSPEIVRINKHAPPHFSFGIQHSPYIAPLIVEVYD